MIEAFPDTDALAAAAAAAITAQLAAGLSARGHATLVGTGGRSPGPVYDRLAQVALPWSDITVTLSDERCVPADHPDANARILRERLLEGPAAEARVLPLWPAPRVADIAAAMPFDAVMLGMGEDGHIASLIPGDPGLEDALTTADLLRHVPAGLGKPPLPRITLTLSALLASRSLFLLVAGRTKREVIQRAIDGEDLPVGRLIAQAAAPIRIFWEPGA